MGNNCCADKDKACGCGTASKKKDEPQPPEPEKGVKPAESQAPSPPVVAAKK